MRTATGFDTRMGDGVGKDVGAAAIVGGAMDGASSEETLQVVEEGKAEVFELGFGFEMVGRVGWATDGILGGRADPKESTGS